MARKPRKPSKQPRSKLTKNQQLFQQELKKLHRRASEWERKRGISFTDFPTMPQRVTRKDIERVKQIRLKNFTPQEIKQYQKEYAYRNLPAVPTDDYSPPTEDDYLTGDYDPYWYEPDWDESWGQQSENPALSTAEMEAWIQEKIDSILNPTLLEREREGAKELLRSIIDNAKEQIGTKGFYEFLQDPENAGKLEASAHAYLQSYQKKNGTDTGGPALEEFTETLNLNRPLTDEQAYELSTYGSVNFDYSGTDYD